MRPDAPKNPAPLFSLTDEQNGDSSKHGPDGQEQSEEPTEEETLVTDLVPILISMKVLGIPLNNCEESPATSEKPTRTWPMTAKLVWRTIIHALVITYGGYFVARQVQSISAERFQPSLDIVNNLITTLSAMAINLSIYRSSSSLGLMLRKLGETPMALDKKPIFSLDTKVFVVTFGSWILQAATVATKLSWCRGNHSAVGATCIGGNATACSSATTVLNIAEMSVRYGILRSTVWISLLFAYFTCMNIRLHLKHLNLGLFHVPRRSLSSQMVRQVRWSHSNFCRMIKVIDASFSTASVFWYLHCVVEILDSLDHLIRFDVEDIWCLPFKSVFGVNILCLLLIMLALSESTHRVSKEARNTVVILAQRSAEIPAYQPELYNHINAMLTSFRKESVDITSCKMWSWNRAAGLLSLLVTVAGILALLLLRDKSRRYVEPYFSL